jgi:hypothetical protein
VATLSRGRLSGFGGMAAHNSAELHAQADALEAQISDPANIDDPRWLRRWVDKIRRLAKQKDAAVAHKDRQHK